MTWRNRNLYIIGLPGAGKSAIGRSLAMMLDRYDFVDLDAEIEARSGRSIAEIFAKEGEEAFRTMESEALLRVASATGKPQIVATGGGIVLRSINRAIMRGSGIPIWIDVTVREASKNIRNDIMTGHSRPLFADTSAEAIRGTLSRLLEERRPWYEQAILHFVTRSIRGDERTPDELATELLTALNQMSLNVALKPRHHTLVAKSAFGNYPIFVGTGTAIRELSYYALEHGYSKIIIVTDENVNRIHGEQLRSSIRKSVEPKVEILQIAVPAGESNKNLENLETVLARFHESNAGRRSALIVAFGGGVVSDITGLAANLYHRGLPVVDIPTTLIGQADAAIGGKTGVNAFGNKNQIGSFYPAKLVLVDPLFLRTLPGREIHAALAEVFKYALIGNAKMWHELAKQVHRLIRGVDAHYEPMIFDAIKEKLRYVEADEFERASGVRELLNFGHTFGHALESATNFQLYRHGEAVLLGMRAAAWLSKELGYLGEAAWKEIEVALTQIPIEGRCELNTEIVFEAFQRDKKGSGRVILLHAIGEAFVTEISDQDACRTIGYMLSLA